MVTRKGLVAEKERFRFKKVTRTGLAVKKGCFSAQSGDENRSRRQKKEFSGSKW
ncbi:hypothetical protein [Caldifermentibacillus hisashii]|uniref:hypothetical protein n=1 Tax=Caldifermentibacillus hisashii TaxID=996558 RepID=UPI0022B95F27|nr:hypothetical protein [Caldifermentibacillus hisashii]